ncbi:hypothetical protein PULV_b0753 [Pseudoalteromonas ulvae UL12]|uniref:AMP-binding protein n=1 Tax=Pseudoalteromonas ulvae TaxID=107327 RepID=UPI00186B7F62|nr:AMP-binding protein [Pseudoalteromonas ulvae]MBE0366026.1 hypothetical protein [Pseudoalteromonas ulvae UL12]
MNPIITSNRHVLDDIALCDHNVMLTYQMMLEEVDKRVAFLKLHHIHCLAIALDNCLEWILFDLAAQQLQITVVPMPTFFSDDQREHVLNQSACDYLLTTDAHFFAAITQLKFSQNSELVFYRIASSSLGARPKETQKVTFTSGSTGMPKGVCLSIENQWRVAQSLANVLDINKPRHLCLLPLSVLLENIAGVYAPLLAGGTVTVIGLETLGFTGSQLIQPEKLLQAVSDHQPDSLILVPELLMLLVRAAQSGWVVPRSLKFIAVGGAHVPEALLHCAHQLGLPVYQGYGLSECGSVVSLNTPGNDQLGSAGHILPHCTVVEEEGELVIQGNCQLGYQNDPASWYPEVIKTGDLGKVVNGTLTLLGRKKNVIISSFGRNIQPEWPEALLLSSGLIKQAVIIGDSRPFCCVLLVIYPGVTPEQVDQLLSKINLSLPDYAQLKQRLILAHDMTAEQGLYTLNNRPKRTEIAHYYSEKIDALYHPSYLSSNPQTCVEELL